MSKYRLYDSSYTAEDVSEGDLIVVTLHRKIQTSGKELSSSLFDESSNKNMLMLVNNLYL